MQKLDDWELMWKRRYDALVPTDSAEEWKTHGGYSIAGGRAAGWTSSNLLVLVSAHGYSITNPRTAEKIRVEDDSDEVVNPLYRENDQRFYVPEYDETINIFGLFSAGGISSTSEDTNYWKLKIAYPNWPRAKIILSKHTLRATLAEYALSQEYSVEWIQAGFSPDGQNLIIIETSEYQIFYR